MELRVQQVRWMRNYQWDKHYMKISTRVLGDAQGRIVVGQNYPKMKSLDLIDIVSGPSCLLADLLHSERHIGPFKLVFK